MVGVDLGEMRCECDQNTLYEISMQIINITLEKSEIIRMNKFIYKSVDDNFK